MAAAGGVPLVPAVSWGSHRFHTTGPRPRWSWRLPVSVHDGEPLHPTPEDDPEEVTAELRRRMASLLDEAVRTYADGTPAGVWWVPERLGGSAPRHDEVERIVRERTGAWRAGEERAS